jgi:pimeloyl-ACP methyl ester carboxylesterase
MQFSAREGWESFALDLRGHGESPCKDFRNASVENYAEDIEAIAIAIGPCYIVGHSLGGLALQLAASRCRLIRKVVFAASAPAGIIGHSKYGARAFSYINDFLLWKPIAIKREDASRFLFDRSPLVEKFDFTIRESPRAILDGGLGRIRLKSLLCPSLVVTAENDRALPLSSTRATAKKYGSDYVQVPNIGHMLMMEEGWEQPISEILRWFEK